MNRPKIISLFLLLNCQYFFAIVLEVRCYEKESTKQKIIVITEADKDSKAAQGINAVHKKNLELFFSFLTTYPKKSHVYFHTLATLYPTFPNNIIDKKLSINQMTQEAYSYTSKIDPDQTVINFIKKLNNDHQKLETMIQQLPPVATKGLQELLSYHNECATNIIDGCVNAKIIMSQTPLEKILTSEFFDKNCFSLNVIFSKINLTYKLFHNPSPLIVIYDRFFITITIDRFLTDCCKLVSSEITGLEPTIHGKLDIGITSLFHILHKCENCSKVATYKCACKEIHYCSIECQKKVGRSIKKLVNICGRNFR